MLCNNGVFQLLWLLEFLPSSIASVVCLLLYSFYLGQFQHIYYVTARDLYPEGLSQYSCQWFFFTNTKTMQENKRVIITGATGLLGRALMQTFQKRFLTSVQGWGFSRADGACLRWVSKWRGMDEKPTIYLALMSSTSIPWINFRKGSAARRHHVHRRRDSGPGVVLSSRGDSCCRRKTSRCRRE